MERLEWSEFETAVGILLVSHGLSYDRACQALSSIGYMRTPQALRLKICRIRKQHPTFCVQGRCWNSTEVHNWVVPLNVNHDQLQVDLAGQSADSSP